MSWTDEDDGYNVWMSGFKWGLVLGAITLSVIKFMLNYLR